MSLRARLLLALRIALGRVATHEPIVGELSESQIRAARDALLRYDDLYDTDVELIRSIHEAISSTKS